MKKTLIVLVTLFLAGCGVQQDKTFQLWNTQFFVPQKYEYDLKFLSSQSHVWNAWYEIGSFIGEMQCLTSQDEEPFWLWYWWEKIKDLAKRVEQKNIQMHQNTCKRFWLSYAGPLDSPPTLDDTICGTRFVLVETGKNYLIRNGGEIGATDHLSIKTDSDLIVTIDFRVAPSNECKQMLLESMSKISK